MTSRKLSIVQPYVPGYRWPFFEELSKELAGSDVELAVIAGRPEGDQLLRGDAATADWLVEVELRQLRVAGRTLLWGGAAPAWRDSDAVVVGLLGSSLDTHRAVLEGMRGLRSVGLWGHVKSYVSDPHPVDEALERWQMRHADMVFAYTPSGAEYALRSGIDAAHITTVMNSIDTGELERARAAVTAQEADDFRAVHGADEGKLFIYLGGLDASKRIDLLADALDELWRRDPGVRMAVLGRGAQEELLHRARDRGQVILYGHANARLKALAAAAGRAFVNPGRVGLIAVDALALGRPVVTSRWPYHAPEMEYLHEGSSLFLCDETGHSFADMVIDLAGRPLRSADVPDWTYPRLDTMVTNFATGVRTMMGIH